MVGESRLRSIWEQARDTLTYGGVLLLLGRAARMGLRPLLSWKTACFFERDLTRPGPEFRTKIPVETRIASREDLERFRDILSEGGVPWDQVEILLARGDLCFLGIVEGRLVHFLWFALSSPRDPALGATVVLGPGEGYVSSSYTVPAMRGHAVQPAVANFLIGSARSRHLKSLFYHVLGENYAGMKIMAASRAAGTTFPRRTVRFFRLVGLKGALVTGLNSPAPPRLEFPATASARRLGRFAIWLPEGIRRPAPHPQSQ